VPQNNAMVEDYRLQIRRFVLDQLESRRVSEIGDDASLVEAGIIDSLGIFQLIAFLESTFRIHISDEEIVLSNFESIATTVDFVSRKLGPA
jgi:acyl carrier protein